jgi:DnaJ-domain-containing protein 1
MPMVEVSLGELVDKITILEIKCERIADSRQQANVRTELSLLAHALASEPQLPSELAGCRQRLKQVNTDLWEIEDEIRACEKNQDFGPRFIELARSVYRVNDIRAAIKREINQLVGSRLVEEKSYTPY